MATTLPTDLHDQLRWLARDLGTSVAALLRLGAMKVLQDCGEELPPSVAHLRRVSFGGQVPQYSHKVNPEVVKVVFDDRLYAALERLADTEALGVHDGVACVVHDLVTRNLPTSGPDPGPIGSALN